MTKTPDPNALMADDPSQVEADNRRQEAKAILDEGLADYTEDMPPNAHDFVEETADRFDRWGDTTFISEAQLDWLRKLKERYL